MTKLRFEEDLQFGKRAEERIRDLLCEAGGLISKFYGTNKNDFQLVFQNKTHRVEIKNEDKKVGTGNICIETNQGFGPRDRVSGIAISEANIIVHTLCERCAMFRRAPMHQYLRDCYKTKSLPMRRFGDNNNRGFIVPLNYIMGFEWFDYMQTNLVGNSKLWRE
jgi:hypothetical protein